MDSALNFLRLLGDRGTNIFKDFAQINTLPLPSFDKLKAGTHVQPLVGKFVWAYTSN